MADPTRLDLLAGEVDGDSVKALLLGRAPNLLDEGSDQYVLFTTEVRGNAVEVLPLAGSAVEGMRWDLAARAVTLGTAASVEWGLYPEQQALGDVGLAHGLTDRYRAILKQLRGSLPGDDGAIDSDGIPAPRGSFPPARYCPDPVFANTYPRDRRL